MDATLIDWSRPMLDRATARVGRTMTGTVTAIQGDIREIGLGDERFDVVVAAAVLHHLRTDEEWQSVFAAFYRALRPGGSVWVFDLIESAIPAVQRLMWGRYGEYLAALKGDAYRDHVFDYVEQEDTPHPRPRIDTTPLADAQRNWPHQKKVKPPKPCAPTVKKVKETAPNKLIPKLKPMTLLTAPSLGRHA